MRASSLPSKVRIASRSISSTLSASRISSRVAAFSASAGRSSSASSRCASAPSAASAGGSGHSRCNAAAAAPVSGRNTASSARLNSVCASAARRAGSPDTASSQPPSTPTNGSASRTAASRNPRLPYSARRAASGARSPSPSGISPAPRFAPSTSVSASPGGATPAAVSETTNKTKATEEWNSQVSAAANSTARIGSDASRLSASPTTGLSRSGVEAATISPSDRIISPKPSAIRPTSRVRSSPAPSAVATPATSSSGVSAERSNDSACTTSVVPRSAPSITASAGASPISPRPTKPDSSIAVAVALCSTAAAPTPAAAARSRFRVAAASARRISGPKLPRTPVLTMLVPHSSSATPPSRLSRIMWPDMRCVLQSGRNGEWRGDAGAILGIETGAPLAPRSPDRPL